MIAIAAHSVYLKLADKILKSGDLTAIEALKGNIRQTYETIKANKELKEMKTKLDAISKKIEDKAVSEDDCNTLADGIKKYDCSHSLERE